MNLIANSGIQLYTIPLEINLNDNFKMYFHEWFDISDSQLKMEIAHYFSEEEIWVKKYDLTDLGYAVAKDDFKVSENWETIKEDFFEYKKSTISIDTDSPEDSGCFSMSINRIKWEKFENIWYPMPFFLLKSNKSEFGPTNWCRFKLIPIEENGNIKKYNLLIAFDTRTVFEKETFEDEDLNETPVFTNNYDRSKDFALCNNEYNLLAFCSKTSNCDWVDKYVLNKFHNLDDINDYRGQKPKLNYLAQYIYLIRYIQQTNTLPAVTLYSNNNVAYGNVDLVVDIGNSRTCTMLFDNGDFNQASPLELQDFTSPILDNQLNKQRDPFDMRLAFREADFGGKLGIENSRQFVYPSMIRLGKEANQLIHKATNLNTGAEKTSTFSSPKRFLWDTKSQKQEWEFIQLEGETTKPIYIEGVSEQLSNDGSLNLEGSGGILMNYSRRALMTFAFLEILAQANMQINSYEQRNHWGNESMPRKIGRIIVTCPTAMSRVEQIALRKCAEDAAIILDRFFQDTYQTEIDEKEVLRNVQVIPSAKNLSNKEEPIEWIYDEATSAQFVFLYAELGERYQKNIENYFDIYGKIRSDLGDYSKKSLTIGSVDIGAGTTDVMIAAYKYDVAGQCSLTPVSLFWESFYTAGDDLMKELIHQIIIEGKHSPIEKKLVSLGKNPVSFMQPFLGTDNGVSFRNRQLRSSFNLQVSVPIISHFLEILKEDKVESQILSFGDIFDENPPTQIVLNHFNSHFGFEFESLQWQYERKVVSAIIEKTFDSLIGKVSSLLSYYDCDIVLLAGRPTSLRPLADIFLKHYAISPNRLKTMNNYRIGRWYPEDKRYPFVDSNGKFINPKSIITTGAMIGNIAENGGLNGFSLNLKDLKKKLLPTTNYFGRLNDRLKYIDTIISPDINSVTIDVVSLPLKIGVRQLDISSYPSRPFYVLDFNDERLEDRIQGRLENENDVNSLKIGVEEEKRKIRSKMPLKVTIERDKNEDMELLRIEEIGDNEGNPLPKNFFSLQIQSMSELDNFWLDSGIFSLNINN
ncbi:virulence factor SrfB [Gelidibacter maritimus]|uniref:Virulence factor SrfB n=1 Tax=Gelidibacter maritimus TaxID=2761487 RepID=A0A7W2M2I3_9FLAO|nr:virulence factor SrfB [Gelidibacter maritimus]MBA6151518.1 virulence factor SrfB [Gelidibacter maritimus]